MKSDREAKRQTDRPGRPREVQTGSRQTGREAHWQICRQDERHTQTYAYRLAATQTGMESLNINNTRKKKLTKAHTHIHNCITGR